MALLPVLFFDPVPTGSRNDCSNGSCAHRFHQKLLLHVASCFALNASMLSGFGSMRRTVVLEIVSQITVIPYFDNQSFSIFRNVSEMLEYFGFYFENVRVRKSPFDPLGRSHQTSADRPQCGQNFILFLRPQIPFLHNFTLYIHSGICFYLPSLLLYTRKQILSQSKVLYRWKKETQHHMRHHEWYSTLFEKLRNHRA